MRIIIRSFIIFICLISLHDMSAQSNSYQVKSEQIKSPTPALFQSLLDSSNLFLKQNAEKAFNYLEKAFVLSLKTGNKKQQFKVFVQFGEFYSSQKQHILASQNYLSALEIDSTSTQNWIIVVKAAHQYTMANDGHKALQYLNRFEYLFNTSEQKLTLHTSRGDAFSKLMNVNQALLEYGKADSLSLILNKIEENTRIKIKRAQLMEQNQGTQALEILQTANQQSISTNNTALNIVSKRKIAAYYNQNARPQLEIKTRKRLILDLDSIPALNDSIKSHFQDEIYQEKIKLAQAYTHLQQFDSSIAILNEENLLNTRGKNQKPHDLELQKEAAKSLYEAYNKLGKHKLAMRYHEKFVELSDSIIIRKEQSLLQISRSNQQLLDYQNQIDYLKKDKNIYDNQLKIIGQQQLIKENKITQQWYYIIGLTIIASLLLSIILLMRQRAKAQKRLQIQSQLKAYKAQMNPHFVFNALNAINHLIAQGNELKTNKYLSKFSKLMRSVLDYSDLEFINLQQEIDFMEHYLDLEHIRFPEKFSYELKVDPNIQTSSWQLPPMLIQPIIENAIWHGLRYLDKQGKLEINIEERNHSLHIQIKDNGIGLKKSKELKSTHQQKHTSKGLLNIEKRLQLISQLYKLNYTFNIKDIPSGGVEAIIQIPKVNP